jgi:hypothetical protein
MKKFLMFLACTFSVLISCDTDFDTLKIVYSSPAKNSYGVLSDFAVEIEFNNDVNRTDIEDNFSIKGSGNVSGSFHWVTGRRFRYVPADPVTATGRYVMEIPRSVRDTDGNTMDTDFISDFYIGTDFVQPAVLSSDPPFTSGASVNIALDHNIVINFSKSMNRESVEKAFSLSPDVAGYFVWSENIPGMGSSRLTYVLLAQMTYGRLYSMSVAKGALDTSGNSLGRDYKVNFITGSDFIPPMVTAVYDSLLAPGSWSDLIVNTGVSKSTKIAVDFSKPMDRVSVEKAFSVTPSVTGSWIWSSDERTVFKPSVPLAPETNYQIYIDKTARDLNGLALETAYSVEIRTSASDSLYLRCGSIYGSSDGVVFELLSMGIPSPVDWPLIITMDALSPYSQDYYIKIQFVSYQSPYTPVNVDKYSVINNALIETFKSAPGGLSVTNARIVNVTWENGSTVIFKFNPLTNKLIADDPPANTVFHSPALYRLTLAGGTNGIKDINSNPAENDIVIEFREAL